MTRAPLSVTAVDTTKVYGDENPAFTVNYDKFVLGEDAGVLGGELEYATEATTSSAVGGWGRGVRTGQRQLRHQVHRGHPHGDQGAAQRDGR